MKKTVCFCFMVLISLCSCKQEKSTCYAVSVLETSGSVKCQVLLDEGSNHFYFKSLEDGEKRHFVGDFYDDIYFYNDKKIVKKDQEGYQELREQALSSSEVYVDFQRTYAFVF